MDANDEYAGGDIEALGPTQSISSMVLKGRYLLGPELGRGGFAVTYLATDRALASRSVVVKILNERHSSQSWSLKKFRDEMEALARIDHPNVVGVMDYGECDDKRPFLVMQFVAGANLRSRIRRGGMPLVAAAEVLQQIGRALTAAHEAGVIHRDIKPENIMIRKGSGGEDEVKLVDFGVAAVGESADANLSANISGTFTYMAPERFRGESSAASDIYEMGIVAHEMLTGVVPFRAPTPVGVALQQMEGLKTPPRELRPDLPIAAEQALTKALSPEPSDRFVTAREFGDTLAAALGSVPSSVVPQQHEPASQARPPQVSIKLAAVIGIAAVALAAAAFVLLRPKPPALLSVAVLPFQNRTGDASLAYLAEGITDSLIDDLSRIPTLRVSARGAVMKYEGREVDASRAGKELHVSRVIDGSVTTRGADLLVETEMIAVSSGARFWGHSYDVQTSDISNVLRHFSTEVTDQLRIRLSPPLKERLRRQYAVGSNSYKQYLKARYSLNRREFADAVRYFSDVAAADPEYAPAQAGLAATYARMAVFGPFFGGADPAPALEQARTAAKRALELDGTLAEAYNARAMVEVRADYAWPEAERDYQRSITLHPNFSETHENYALELGALGRFSDALREIDWAEKLEPDNSHFRSAHGLILYMARRYDRSLSILSEIAKTPGGVSRVAAPMTMNYWVKSQPDEALKILEQMPTDTTPELRVPLLATAYARLGQRERAEQLLRDLDLPGKKAWWYYLAIAHLNLGRRDEAVEDLQRAYRERWGDVVWIGVEPMFDPLRSNPGFRRLMETLKLSSGTAAKG